MKPNRAERRRWWVSPRNGGPSIPAKCRGGHWSADKCSQATVFGVREGLWCCGSRSSCTTSLLRRTALSFWAVTVCVWRLRTAQLCWIAVGQQECSGVVQKNTGKV